jgi:hypothetical protein
LIPVGKKYNNLGLDLIISVWLPFCIEVIEYRKMKARCGFLFLKNIKPVRKIIAL